MGRNFRVDPNIGTDWEIALDEYIAFKKAQRRRESTLDDYRQFISQFYRRYPDAGFNLKALKSCCADWLGDKVSPSTYNLRLTYLKGYFEFCVQEGYLKSNPLSMYKIQRTHSRIVDVPVTKLQQLLKLPDKTTWTGLRDYTLILLTLDTGIRPGEAFQLLVPDFHLNALEVTVRAEVSKTNSARTISLSPITVQAVRKLIANRPEEWPESVPVFCCSNGVPLNKNTWGQRMEYYSSLLGFKIRPYDLRHCFALNYLRGGGSPFGLQKTLGHTDLNMTKTYIALTSEDMRAEHGVASPLNTLLPNSRRTAKVYK